LENNAVKATFFGKFHYEGGIIVAFVKISRPVL